VTRQCGEGCLTCDLQCFPCCSKGKVATYEEIAKFVHFHSYIETTCRLF